MQIELIEPTGEQKNIYRDTVPEGKTAFHHLCYWTDDIDAEIASLVAQGYEVAATGQVAGGGATFPTISPTSERTITDVPAGSRCDIEAAVAAARSAFDGSSWGTQPGCERAVCLRALAAGCLCLCLGLLGFIGGPVCLHLWFDNIKLPADENRQRKRHSRDKISCFRCHFFGFPNLHFFSAELCCLPIPAPLAHQGTGS